MAFRSRTVLILGAGGIVGRQLLELLAEDSEISKVVATHHERVTDLPGKPLFVRLEPNDESAVQAIADLIDEHDVDTIIYMSYLSDRTSVQETTADEAKWVHKALLKRPMPKVIFVSTTCAYGALPGDPTHLNEDTPLAEDPQSAWVADKVAAERVYQDYILDADGTVTILRMALVLGPEVSNFMTDYMKRRAVPVIMNQDPQVQFLHERDAAASIHHALGKDCDGPYNVVGDGALPLSVALRIGRRRSAQVPEFGSYPLHHALWEPDIIEAPAVLHDLFRFIWVADPQRTHNEIKFSPRRSTKETLEDFYRAHPKQPTPKKK